MISPCGHPKEKFLPPPLKKKVKTEPRGFGMPLLPPPPPPAPPPLLRVGA